MGAAKMKYFILLTILLAGCASAPAKKLHTYECTTLVSHSSVIHVLIPAETVDEAFSVMKKLLPGREFYSCGDEVRITRE